MTNSLSKGKRGEREIVNILKSKGVAAKRISMQETGGIDKGDIEIAGVWIGQVKQGSHVPQMFYEVFKNGEHMAFVRQDRRDWVVCMKLDFFLDTFV